MRKPPMYYVTRFILLIIFSAGILPFLTACGSSSILPPASSVTNASIVSRTVPDLSLINEQGNAVTLASFRGKVIVLAPFLTLCSEVCPITTGAFEQMQNAVKKAGEENNVVFVEITVDPGRDVPARLNAYASMTGVTFPLLTGTPQNIAALWKFFGVGYQSVPEGSPPTIDWWTHQPETYDVSHSDGIFIINPQGKETVIMLGMPTLPEGKLAAPLYTLLNSTGVNNLTHPVGGWTVSQALENLSYVLGHPIAYNAPSG